MKKVLLAIAAVATITSCSQNEEFENPAQNAEINFSTIVSKSTRAVIIENKDFKKFTAYGYSHGETNFTGVVTSTIMSSAEYTKVKMEAGLHQGVIIGRHLVRLLSLDMEEWLLQRMLKKTVSFLL